MLHDPFPTSGHASYGPFPRIGRITQTNLAQSKTSIHSTCFGQLAQRFTPCWWCSCFRLEEVRPIWPTTTHEPFSTCNIHHTKGIRDQHQSRSTSRISGLATLHPRIRRRGIITFTRPLCAHSRRATESSGVHLAPQHTRYRRKRVVAQESRGHARQDAHFAHVCTSAKGNRSVCVHRQSIQVGTSSRGQGRCVIGVARKPALYVLLSCITR